MPTARQDLSPTAVVSIENSVQQRTRRSIRGLNVRIDEGSVVLHGETTTFYVKQLATLAVQELLGDFTLRNEINVI